jgi:hypothetical protein
LNPEDARIVYWAAYFGNLDVVRKAVEIFGFSPANKCFKGRNLVTAAIIGG